jgi:hypothetical protein
MRAFTALLCAALLMIFPVEGIAGAEAALQAEAVTLPAEPLPTVVAPLPTQAPALTEAPSEAPAATDAGEAAGRELSGYYGGDIARAAEELGGLTFSAGEEYSENYEGPTLTLRGQGGRVTMIELKDAPGGDSLCGVTIGMPRAEVETLMAGCPMLWQFDEEVAFTVRADAENALNSETLVVFLNEEGRVNGAWYRAGN